MGIIKGCLKPSIDRRMGSVRLDGRSDKHMNIFNRQIIPPHPQASQNSAVIEHLTECSHALQMLHRHGGP